MKSANVVNIKGRLLLHTIAKFQHQSLGVHPSSQVS